MPDAFKAALLEWVHGFLLGYRSSLKQALIVNLKLKLLAASHLF